jgi:hypothetical protein
MSVDRGRAFSIVNLRTGGSGPFQPHVRVFCSNCTGRLEFACVNSRPPEAIAKTIRAKGWEFILENARYTRCPDCIILRDAARKGESPGPKRQEVELFGRSVAVPPDLRAPPPPAREARVFKEKGSSDGDGIENAARRASPPSLGGLSAAGAQRYRIELTTERDLADVVTALKTIGLTTMIALITHEAEPNAPRTPAAVERVAKIRQSMADRSRAYTERVRNALLEIRRAKSNGREPTAFEYARALTAMGVEPFRPGRPWSHTIVQKHLDAMDSH